MFPSFHICSNLPHFFPLQWNVYIRLNHTFLTQTFRDDDRKTQSVCCSRLHLEVFQVNHPAADPWLSPKGSEQYAVMQTAQQWQVQYVAVFNLQWNICLTHLRSAQVHMDLFPWLHTGSCLLKWKSCQNIARQEKKIWCTDVYYIISHKYCFVLSCLTNQRVRMTKCHHFNKLMKAERGFSFC